MFMRVWGEIIYYLKEMLTIAVPAAIVFSCFWPYRRRALSAMGLRTSVWREAGLILFILCLFGVLAVTLWPIYQVQKDSGGAVLLLVGRPSALYNVNLTPFLMFSDYLREIQAGNALFVIINFFGNLAVFVPLGLFPALLFREGSWKRSFLVGITTSLFVECGQYLIARSVDIDDIILNTLGAMCGYWLFVLLKRIAPHFFIRFQCKTVEVPDGRQTGNRTSTQRTGTG